MLTERMVLISGKPRFFQLFMPEGRALSGGVVHVTRRRLCKGLIVCCWGA